MWREVEVSYIVFPVSMHIDALHVGPAGKQIMWLLLDADKKKAKINIPLAKNSYFSIFL